MPAPYERPHRRDLGAVARRRHLSTRIAPVLLMTLACVVLVAAVATAAEVTAAELEGTVNVVSVEQGGSATFTISVRATGTIRCSATPDNPATAQFPTAFAVGLLGEVGASTPSTPLAFFGLGSGTCDVSWPGDPDSHAVAATVTAHLDSPVGDHVVRLTPTLFTPLGSGTLLRDDTPTLITIRVTPGSDRTPPALDCQGPTGAAGAAGWYTTDVAHDCTALDTGSGLADPADASFGLSTDGEGVVSTDSRSVADVVGNAATAGPFGPYNVDLHDPIVTVSEPADGAAYTLDSSVTPSYECADTPDGSGVAACDADSIDTSSVGSKTFTVTAVDEAGRTTTVSRSYDVIYDVTPIAANGPTRKHQAGASLNVRWSIEGLSDPSAIEGLSSAQAPCGSETVASGASPVAGSPVRYDPTTEQFSFNWRTERAWAGTCRQLQISLNDGTTRTLNVEFK